MRCKMVEWFSEKRGMLEIVDPKYLKCSTIEMLRLFLISRIIEPLVPLENIRIDLCLLIF